MAALIILFATAVKDTVSALKPEETLLQKLSEYGNLMPGMISFVPMAGNLSAELQVLKGSVGDDVAAVEMLVTSLAFSNDHAQKIVAAAFPVLEWAAEGEPKIVALATAIKG